MIRVHLIMTSNMTFLISNVQIFSLVVVKGIVVKAEELIIKSNEFRIHYIPTIKSINEADLEVSLCSNFGIISAYHF